MVVIACSRKVLFGASSFHVPFQSAEGTPQPAVAANAQRTIQPSFEFLTNFVLSYKIVSAFRDCGVDGAGDAMRGHSDGSYHCGSVLGG